MHVAATTTTLFLSLTFQLTLIESVSVLSAFCLSDVTECSTFPKGLGSMAAAITNSNDEGGEDPFAVFDNDEEEEDAAEDASSQSKIPITREAANGPMSYHEGVEQALLQYVRNKLDLDAATIQGGVGSKSEAVIRLVDEFCMTRHWMMHIGPEKGAILDDFLKQSLQAFDQQTGVSNEPFVALEIGTYCGYSTIRLLHKMRQHLRQDQRFHILTVDVNPRHQYVARQLVELAGFSDHVTFLLLERKTLGEIVRGAMKDFEMPDMRVDFVFLDHEKGLYLADLRTLEQSKIVSSGCFVAADNVVVFQIDDYRQHLSQLASMGIVETKLVMSHLEYIDPRTEGHLKDGLECTVYQKEPPLI